MTYAREQGKRLVKPTDAEFVGIPNWRTNDVVLRRKGYLPRIGEPEPREGYTAEPSAWHKVEQTSTRVEPRPYIVEDFDPETHEKTGEHTEWRDTEITLDASYWQVDAWEYVPIPPAPPPVVRYSKYKIQLACQRRNLWEQVKEAVANAGLTDSWYNIQDIASDNQELKDALPDIREAFGSELVDEVLAESIAD